VGTRVTRELAAGARDRTSVHLQAGEFVKWVAIQQGADLVLRLLDSRDREVSQVDSANGSFGPEVLVAIAEETGEYTLEVRESSSSATTYPLTLAALRLATPQDRREIEARLQLSRAWVLLNQHKPESRASAIELLHLARPVFAGLPDRYYEAVTLLVESSMQAEAGDSREALVNAEGAIRKFDAAGDVYGAGVAGTITGGMLDILGEPQKAIDAYRTSLEAYRRLGVLAPQVSPLNNIGKVEADRGNWQAALDIYGQALALARETGDLRRQGLLLHNIGSAYRSLGDYGQAMALLEQGLSVRRTLQDKSGEAQSLGGLASTLAKLGRFDQALEYYQQALALYLGLGNRRSQAETMKGIGRTYAQIGEFAKAEGFLRQTLDLERTLQDRLTGARTRMELGRVLALDAKPAEGLAQAEQALKEFQGIGDHDSEESAQAVLAAIESRQDHLAAARAHMEEALRLGEDNRTRASSDELRASLFSTRQDSYNFYIDLLMRMRASTPGEDLAARALEASERSRARSLIDMLGESGADVHEGADPKLLAREKQITEELNAKGARLLPLAGQTSARVTELQQEIRDLEREYQEVRAAIRQTSPRYAALTQPQPLTLKAIQSHVLDPDTLLLEYALGPERSYLWVVGATSLQSFELPARALIEAKTERVYELLTARAAAIRGETTAARTRRLAQADADLPRASRELSQIILGPAAALLGTRRLAVVADGALQRLPFAMLPAPGSQDPLIASHEVVMEPSASALAILRTQISGRTPAQKMLAVFADPVFDRSDPRAGAVPTSAAVNVSGNNSRDLRILEHLSDTSGGTAAASLRIPRLPFTQQEAQQILRVAADSSNLKAFDFDASRATATSGDLSNFRYIHFATHGYLDAEHPNLSALVLSQVNAKGDALDGFLRVPDVYNFNLSAELVVLSACQTGLGKEVRGEGLMGLTRAFLYAGAPRVIVSLWNVNDRATADLMASLYRNMLREGKQPAAALRAAQLELRKQKRWESPYYWAAFVQNGEWR
jgi:CHAT domain-containing protein